MASTQELASMKRADLQRLCKDYNIKANLRTDQLIELLMKEMNIGTDSSSRPGTAASIRAGSTLGQRASKLRRSLSQPSLRHVRSSSRDSNKPPPPLPTLRKLPPTSTTTASKTSTMAKVAGKENGLPVPSVAARTVVKTATGPTATGTVAKGIAGRIAVFSRSMASSSTKATLDAQPIGTIPARRVATTKPPIPKAATNSATSASAMETRIQAIEAKHAEFALQTEVERQSTHQALSTAQKEILDLHDVVASKNAEIASLRTQVDDNRSRSEERAAANDELREMVQKLMARVTTLEDAVQQGKEETEGLRARATESEALKSKMEELESSVTSLTEQVVRSAESQSKRTTGSAGFGTPVGFSFGFNRPSLEGTGGSIASTDFPRYHYLDLELNSTPSTKRTLAGPAHRKGAHVFGQDALLQYNGFAGVAIDDSPRPFL